VPEAGSSAIKEQIIAALGKPADLLKVVARPLWERCYRVNVFVGPDATSCKVAHSYFLEADGNGKILSSSPVLARMY